ncbi:MAG TPA: formylmethanofuran dehydrogenase subunit A [Methanospirillum sp.]|uniref:formylmethanofuran dehydrogenase subunit A n=1 Tax=Methanospirillum sp. TaxID=45200 RepID=UPI002C81E820|nr:formylmethanofuran dehydrogenase subunit A [Methanospirillum sp.]HPY60448.1 formylmethanofuran dehydrogenase subunit A [Methanospirillum sp.]
MREILIKNAFVIDPVQGIHGDIMDIPIREGRIVDKVSGNCEVIDAGGNLTLPGGIDSHTHVCGTKVNFGRYMSPEDMRAGRTPRRGAMYPTSGYTVPTTYGNSYRYSRMGYTTLLEGAMAPLEARHTHEEFAATPMQDMLANTLFDGNWSLFEAVADKDIRQAAAVIGWTLSAVRGFGIKLTNPGGTEAWGFGDDLSSIDETVPNWDITPRDIIDTTINACELLHLPHSVHLHCNNLGMPGNYRTTLQTLDIPSDLNPDRQTLYLTHVQFHSYGGSTWSDICSEAGKVASSVNAKPQIVIDMGQVMFGRTMTMTADGPMEFRLYTLHHNKWSNHDVELETGSGVIPVYYSRKSAVNSIMWAIGLELALLVKNPWQCMLTTDNPNGAPFVKYPEIIGLLMSNKYREKEIGQVHRLTTERTSLGTIDRELSFEEIAVMTRAGQAKALGIIDQGKGHLKEGALADIAIYPVKPDQTDPSLQYEEVIGAFQQTLYTLKDGIVVSRDGEIIRGVPNRTFWVKADLPGDMDVMKNPRFVEKFSRYYSVDLENYMVQDEYVERGVVMNTRPE